MTVISAVSPVTLVKFFFGNPVAWEELIKVHAHACMATIYLSLNLWVLVQSDPRRSFSCSNLCSSGIGVACRVICICYCVDPTSFAGFLAGVALQNARIFTSAALLGDATLNTRISKPTAFKTTPRHLYLWACLLSLSSLIFVELRKTCDFKYNTSWDVQLCIQLNKIPS